MYGNKAITNQNGENMKNIVTKKDMPRIEKNIANWEKAIKGGGWDGNIEFAEKKLARFKEMKRQVLLFGNVNLIVFNDTWK